MPLIKLIAIDFAFILVGIFLLFLLKQGGEKISIIDNFNSKKIIYDPSLKIPNLTELLKYENSARKKGSGIEFDSLIGSWQFTSVWKSNSDKQDKIASSLLRLFNATLEIKNNSDKKYGLINSIEFGILKISFIGSGELKGNQPLLPFYFEIIELKLRNKILLSRLLKIPEVKNRPFFALIAKDEKGKWLSARGRGGGLALWVKS